MNYKIILLVSVFWLLTLGGLLAYQQSVINKLKTGSQSALPRGQDFESQKLIQEIRNTKRLIGIIQQFKEDSLMVESEVADISRLADLNLDQQTTLPKILKIYTIKLAPDTVFSANKLEEGSAVLITTLESIYDSEMLTAKEVSSP